MYLNKVLIYGNLTRDPELKALPSGSQVTNFSVATNRTWKDKDGAKQEDVEFHNVVVFGRQAETVAQYMKKGSGILVEGRLQTRSWEADGVKKYRTEIIAERTQFCTRSQNDGQTTQRPDSDHNNDTEAPVASQDDSDENINPDEITF